MPLFTSKHSPNFTPASLGPLTNRLCILGVSLFFLASLNSHKVSASDIETWDLMEETSDRAHETSGWSDYDEAKPDIHPDTWRVSKLARFNGEEIHLLNSRGAGLRWLTTDQIKSLNSVYQSIKQVSELQAELYIMRGDDANAAAGQYKDHNLVFINFGMLNLIGSDDDQWAAIFGHELAHLKLQHGQQRSKRSLPLKVLKAVGQAVVADPLTSLATKFMFDGIGKKFDRDEERASDYMGVIWSVEAGYDAYGAAELHRKLMANKTNFSIPFINSHPSSAERIESLSSLADRLSGRSGEKP